MVAAGFELVLPAMPAFSVPRNKYQGHGNLPSEELYAVIYIYIYIVIEIRNKICTKLINFYIGKLGMPL